MNGPLYGNNCVLEGNICKNCAAQNERNCRTLCVHLCEMLKHQVSEEEKIWVI